LELMREGQAIAGFFHLAAARQDKIDLMRKLRLTVISYEQVEEEDGHRPILAPLSQIGGQMAVQVAARLMQNDHGGRGILLGGVAGVPPAEVVILGAGTVGSTAARSFLSAGAHVTVLDINLRKLQQLQAALPFPVVTMLSTAYNVQRACSYADVLIGAVAVPGERTPILVSRQMVARMKPRSVIIDMSIDQGGCLETSRPTHHGSPTYVEEGIIHYCVPNMSGVLGRTATHALYYGAYPFLEAIAVHGMQQALERLPSLERGVAFLEGEARHLKRLVEGGNGA
jgi:alanine dehydrogenase